MAGMFDGVEEGTGTDPAPIEGGTPVVEPATSVVATGDRPDWIPETAWKDGAPDLAALEQHVATLGKHADLPADADAYVMPTIEGFDAEKAKDSPLFVALRKGAHANGLGQAAFEGVIKDYVEGEITRTTNDAAQERAKLGSNGATRLTEVSKWVKSSLPEAQARAVLAGATTADAVIGLEALMNARAGVKPRDNPPPAVVLDSKQDIEKLMQTKAYSGKAHERDPAVIARVEKYFAAVNAANVKK